MSEHTESTEKSSRKKKSGLPVWAMVLIAAALTAGVVFAVIKGKESVEKKAKEEAVKEVIASEDLKKTTLAYLSEEHTSEEIEKELLSAFKSLDANDCTQIVDTYIKGTYSAAMQYALSDAETNALSYAMNPDRTFDYSLIEDETLRTTLSALEKQHIVPRYVNGELFIDVDYGYFAETFGNHILPDYAEVLRLYNEEKTVDYCDETRTVMYTDVVEKRLDRLFNLKAQFPQSQIMDIIDDSYYFYKAIYFGAYAQGYVFDDTARLRNTVKTAYEGYGNTCLDAEMKEFITSLLADYKEVEYVRTVPIFEKIKKFCGFYAEGD